MGRDMRVRVWLPALAGLAASGSPLAAQETPYAKVGGYDIARTGPADKPFSCRMSKSSFEASDGNAEKVVIVAAKPAGIVVSLAYERWAWENAKPPAVRYRLDDQEIKPLGAIYAERFALGALFPDALLPKIEAGRRIVVEVKGGKVGFDLGEVRPAYQAVLRCNRNEPPPEPTPPQAASPQAAAPQAPSPQAAAPPAPPPVAAAPPPAKPAEPAPRPPAPATEAPAAAPASKPPLPSEPRIVAYMLGLGLLDLIERCDVATTAKQRAGITAKVEALRPEMAEVETAIRETLAKQMDVSCPEADDPDPREAVALYVDKAPEDFAAQWEAKRGDMVAGEAKRIVEALRPPGPPRARIATYLYGLLLQDMTERCEVATTGKQRAGLRAKVQELRTEMAAHEEALRKQRSGFTDCPPADQLAEFQTVLPLFLERTPEAFAAEMDRRSAARKAAGPSATDAEPKPPAEPGCRKGAIPWTAAQLRQGLAERFGQELPSVRFEDFQSTDTGDGFKFKPGDGKDADKAGSGESGPAGFLTFFKNEGRIDSVLVSSPVESETWRRALTLVAGHVIGAFDDSQSEEAIARQLAPLVTDGARSLDAPIPFGPVLLHFTKLDNEQGISINRWNGADCPMAGGQ